MAIGEMTSTVTCKAKAGDQVYLEAMAYARRSAADAARTLDLPRLQHIADEIDAKTTPVICEVLRRLRAFQGATRGLSLVETVAAMPIIPAYTKLVRRWILDMTQEGVVLRSSEGFKAHRLRSISVSNEAENPYFDAICTMLVEVLTGRHHVLEYVFGSRRPAWLTAYSATGYDADPVFVYQHKVVADVVGVYARHASRQDPLHVLEIGAGMGGLTAYLVPLLPHGAAHYFYTDIAREFFAFGEQRFRHAEGLVDYSVYDINKPPTTCKIPLRYFDIVVAFDVLHCAQDLPQTLAWISTVLRPGGVLVNEQLTRNRLSHLIFPGIMPGFTDFEDFRLQDYRSLPTPEIWRAELAASGFTDCYILPEDGGLVDDLGHGIIIARFATKPSPHCGVI